MVNALTPIWRVTSLMKTYETEWRVGAYKLRPYVLAGYERLQFNILMIWWMRKPRTQCLTLHLRPSSTLRWTEWMLSDDLDHSPCGTLWKFASCVNAIDTRIYAPAGSGMPSVLIISGYFPLSFAFLSCSCFYFYLSWIFPIYTQRIVVTHMSCSANLPNNPIWSMFLFYVYVYVAITARAFWVPDALCIISSCSCFFCHVRSFGLNTRFYLFILSLRPVQHNHYI